MTLELKKLTWAEEIGQDKYGQYAVIEVKGVRQRLRFIEPGEFMMGSPEGEPDRYANEGPQHRVQVDGYWLFDTTVTQALWYAVMGNNPSNNQSSPDLPVECVSWHDCNEFIDTINKLKPGLNLRLPSEAEWEYACRAGTTGPFSFGDNITPGQVNYDGNYPYNDGKEGEYRKKTVTVKSLPPNEWGLYEMHGNVWEWVEDVYREYGDE